MLHAAEGIIRESQQNAAMLFNTGHTFYSTEGSSLCIKVMIDALLQRGKNAPGAGSGQCGRQYWRLVMFTGQ